MHLDLLLSKHRDILEGQLDVIIEMHIEAMIKHTGNCTQILIYKDQRDTLQGCHYVNLQIALAGCD